MYSKQLFERKSFFRNLPSLVGAFFLFLVLQPIFFNSLKAQTGPGNVSTGILTWLDASDINGDNIANNPADGTPISTWVDKSGNGNNAVSLNVDAVLESDAGSLIGGSPVLRFANQSWYSFSGIDIRANSIPDLTLIITYRQGNPIGGTSGLAGNDNGAWDRFVFSHFNGTDGIASRGPGQTPPFTSIPGSGVPGNIYVFTAVYDGNVVGGVNNGPVNGSSFYINGISLGNFTDLTDASNAQSNLHLGHDGDNNPFDGDIAEFIAYDRTLDPCEIQQVSAYLSQKYQQSQIAPLTITASGPTTNLAANQSVTLTANTGSGFQWKKDGVDIFGATSNSYVVTTPGDYSVGATISGCSSAESAPIVVSYANSAPVPTLSQWGLILLGLIVMAMGTVIVWKKKFAVVG